MAHKKGFIPNSYPLYDSFFKNVCQYVNTKCTGGTPEWTHIPAAERTALTDAYADWYTYYARVKVPHTKADTAAAKAAFTRSKKVLARFIRVWFRGFQDIVTDEDLANMNIPPIDKTHTPIGRPTTRPVFHIVVKDTRLLAIHFQDQDTESKAIPYGMNGAVISWGCFDAPPPRPEALMHTELATRTPHPLRFAGEDGLHRAAMAERIGRPGGFHGDAERDYSVKDKRREEFYRKVEGVCWKFLPQSQKSQIS